ncbi:MAG TPA: divergent PAP2 family protein [Anaerolineales bacterium]|nr:divergent PAP2 family protein [Anaerolineales bacterium]
MLSLLNNYVLIAALTAWALAQIIKVPYEYLRSKEWDWALLLRAGGMPSSHTSLLIGATHAIGLSAGFDSPIFALAVAISMVVVYDATGIRRQAGMHAALINGMLRDMAAGHPLKQEQLREVLGHTPLEVVGGFFLGIIIAQLVWFFWK